MTYRSQRRPKRMIAEINVVPYIDVMLVLLIIFMVTAPLLSTGVTVELPKAAAEPMQNDDEEPFVVTVDKDGNYYINDDEDVLAADREIELKARAVLERNPELPFVIRGDGDADYAFVMQAMVLLQKAGVESVGLVTDPPEP